MSTQRKLAEETDYPERLPDNAVVRALDDWFSQYGCCTDECDWNKCWPQMREHIESAIGVSQS